MAQGQKNNIMKYIITKEFEEGLEKAILFDEFIDHELMHKMLDSPILVSAGFFIYDECIRQDFKMYCYGKSTSLKVSSRPDEDTQLIKFSLTH